MKPLHKQIARIPTLDDIFKQGIMFEEKGTATLELTGLQVASEHFESLEEILQHPDLPEDVSILCRVPRFSDKIQIILESAEWDPPAEGMMPPIIDLHWQMVPNPEEQTVKCIPVAKGSTPAPDPKTTSTTGVLQELASPPPSTALEEFPLV